MSEKCLDGKLPSIFQGINYNYEEIRHNILKEYYNNLSEFAKEVIIQYKSTAYQYFTKGSVKYFALTPDERRKIIETRTAEKINENKQKRLSINKVKDRFNYIVAEKIKGTIPKSNGKSKANLENEKRINTLVTKPELLYFLNKIILDAPIPVKKPLTVYRGMTYKPATQYFHDMNIGDIYKVPNVLSTADIESAAANFVTSAFNDGKDTFLQVLLEFRLDANYPRYDMMYIERCVKRNPENEYLLPSMLQKGNLNTDSEIVYTTEGTSYTQAKWRCIEKTTYNQSILKVIFVPWRNEDEGKARLNNFMKGEEIDIRGQAFYGGRKTRKYKKTRKNRK